MEVERVDLDEWARALPTRGFEVFHTPAALSVLAEHARGALRLVVGYNGDRPVGLCPVFEVARPIGATVVSPPPSMGVPRLGPILSPASPKQRKQERLNRRFVRAVSAAFDVGRPLTFARLICSPDYGDPRPYVWDGMSVSPAFTYVLETAGRTTDDLFGSASKSLRREIRDAQAGELTVEREGPAAAERVYEQTAARYAEQDVPFSLGRDYVSDLVDALAEDDRCRVYVARAPDDSFVSGVTVLYSNDAAYFWQGGARETYEGLSVNSLLHWRIVEDLVADPPRGTVTRYDLHGANTERLCRYKSKFGAELRPYYVVESGGAPMALAKRAYGALGLVR